MARNAILVEDEEQQVVFTTSILRRIGFTVHVQSHADAALLAVAVVPRPIDLVVLDRRLPQGGGDEPEDLVGDRLLDALLLRLPDSPFVIFTGYTGVPHQQFATRERGVITLGPGGGTIDRVTAFDKSQTIEFEEYVRAISALIDKLDDVEASVEGEVALGGEAATRRLLKRAAVELHASAIRARRLAGGLASAAVWSCLLRSDAGVHVGAVILKQAERRTGAPGGGLHTLLPSAFIAAPLMVVGGMCDNQVGQLMQLAGSEPVSLLTELSEAPEAAATHLSSIADAIKALLPAAFESSVSLAELCSPLTPDWEQVALRMREYDVAVPRGTMLASTRRTAQHGDLHPGNILVIGDQPVLIDFDNEVLGSSVLDPVTALLSPLFHIDSPVRAGLWPSPDQCAVLGTDEFFVGSPCEAWMRVAWNWLIEARTSDREMWGLVYAFAGRQLKYRDVRDDPAVAARAVALARVAVERLAET